MIVHKKPGTLDNAIFLGNNWQHLIMDYWDYDIQYHHLFDTWL